MRAVEWLRALVLRWDRILMVLALGLSLTGTMIFGMLWLWERGWLLAYLAISVVLVAAIRLLHALAVRRSRRVGPVPVTLPDGPPPSDDWTEAERAAYARARALIRADLAAPLEWEAMPGQALAVVEAVASDLSGGRRGALHFTAPEALLLIGRLAERYRGLLQSHVPFADRLSLQTLWWIWQRQDTARAAAQGGWLIWRGVRLVANPAAGILREAERALASSLQDRLGATLTRDLQARLLDEAARAAIDLYSGRLRFTEAELARAPLADVARDAQREEGPPLRMLLVGQISVGKSTLLNLLADTDAAETDAAPVTDRAAAEVVELGGVPLRIVDTPGLDGSPRRRDKVAAEAAEADLLLWILRADRPDRGPDQALRAALDARLAKNPERRAPPIIPVAAAVDLLLPAWPYPEHRLPPDARNRLGAGLAALAEDWGRPPVPVSAEPEPWNFDVLEAAIMAALPEARQVQRQRRRLAARKTPAAERLTQAGRGIRAAAGMVSGALASRFRKPGA